MGPIDGALPVLLSKYGLELLVRNNLINHSHKFFTTFACADWHSLSSVYPQLEGN